MSRFTVPECEEYLLSQTGLKIDVSMQELSDQTIVLVGHIHGKKVLDQNPSPDSLIQLQIPQYLQFENRMFNTRLKIIELLQSIAVQETIFSCAHYGKRDNSTVLSLTNMREGIRRCTEIVFSLPDEEVRILFQKILSHRH